MKKQIGLFTAILFAVSTLMVSCSSEVHEHTFAEEWSSDETNHWHAATCGCSDVELKKTEHTFGDWTITKEPTEEAEGSQEKSCSVCEHKVTEVIAKLEHTHTFGEWKVTKEPTEEAKGSKERVCDVCKHKETAEIAQLDHKHVAGESWKNDDKNHWKECTGCKEQLESADHEYEWIVTKEATCTEEGTETGTCKVCKKEVTEKIDVKGHSFGIWTTTKEATCTEEGSKTCVCEVCKKEVTEKIDAKGHSYSGSWENDDKNHWKECTVCKEKLESADHEYEWTVIKAATCTEEGTKTGTCKVCKKEVTEKIDAKGHSGIWEIAKDSTETESVQMKRVCKECEETETKELEGFKFVKGTTITGTESWTPESRVFVSGRKLTIPALLVSDHEVTRGEYKAVMGSDPSKGSAYDKDGNELEGDAALNNPVNCVSWYDALVYCNKLSKAEGLTPCYSIDGSTDPEDWGEVPTSRNNTWNAATCNFEADGYRLPTEAERDWLARGGENYEYAGSDTIDDVAWYDDNTEEIGKSGTRDVKSKAPNGYGLYDMCGNVWELCWDWYVYNRNISDSTPADGPSAFDALSVGYYRVKCGGSWSYSSLDCVVCSRTAEGPSNRYSSDGFRVVRTAK